MLFTDGLYVAGYFHFHYLFVIAKKKQKKKLATPSVCCWSGPITLGTTINMQWVLLNSHFTLSIGGRRRALRCGEDKPGVDSDQPKRCCSFFSRNRLCFPKTAVLLLLRLDSRCLIEIYKPIKCRSMCKLTHISCNIPPIEVLKILLAKRFDSYTAIFISGVSANL